MHVKDAEGVGTTTMKNDNVVREGLPARVNGAQVVTADSRDSAPDPTVLEMAKQHTQNI